MQNYEVTGKSIRLGGGIVRLTDEQAKAREHLLEETDKPGIYKITGEFDFKKGEVFGFDGELPKATVMSLEHASGLKKTKAETPQNAAPLGGLAPATSGDGPDAKSLFAELQLGFQAGKALLKKEFDFDVQANATTVPAEIADKARKLHTP